MSVDHHFRVGSIFGSFQEEEGIREEVNANAIKRVIAWQLAETIKEQRVSKLVGRRLRLELV